MAITLEERIPGPLNVSGVATFASTVVVSGQIQAQDGLESAPAYSFSSSTGSGLYLNGAALQFGVGGTAMFRITNSNLQITSAGHFGWSSGAIAATSDLFLHRNGADSLLLGDVASATPATNTFTVGESARGGTDPDTAGGSGVFRSGLGTGVGALATLSFQTAVVAAAGSTAQTYSTRLTLAAAGATLTVPLLFTDNTLDIGASGATRPRTGYFGTSVVVQSGANSLLSLGSTNTDRASGGLIRWSDSATGLTTIDTGIARNAAGVLEINSGTAGALRDLTCRNATFSTLVTMSSTSHFVPASGTTAQRPGGNTASQTRYNTTDNKLEYNNGSGWVQLAAGSAITGKTLITVTALSAASGTFTPNAATSLIIVQAVGPGGGGGGAAQGVSLGRGAGGGGAGAFALVLISSIAASYPYTCGAGGAGGTAGNNAGSNGSASTTFGSGSLITCPAGSGGTSGAASASASSAGGAGGTVATNTITGTALVLASGQPGLPGSVAQAGANVFSGNGGSSMFGSGALGVVAASTTSSAGVNAGSTDYGSGGSGAAAGTNSSDRAGGNGANGYILVWEYGT